MAVRRIDPPELTSQEIQHFWSRINTDPGQGPQGECWEWQYGKTYYRYGKFAITRKGIKRHMLAHQTAYFLAKEEWPSPMFVLHRCDNPPCCNPAHLFKGTPAANMQDKVSKGRQSKGETHSAAMRRVAARGLRNAAYTHPERVLRGEDHGNARLTDDKVRLIRSSPLTGAALARLLHVGETTIYRVRRGEYWKHVI